jgi:glucose-1-phosphate cytidylyltransferase
MKAVILAGGYGTRLEEETVVKPKPMIEIGGKPILWHILKTYSHYGINDFIICLGYKGYIIKEYFANYFTHSSDLTIDIQNNKIEIHSVNSEPWKITLVDTGETSMTGGRIKRIEKFVDDTFLMTYGDGVADIDIRKLIDFHKKNKTIGTLTAVQPPGRFGTLEIKNNKITKFVEKPSGDNSWINGGYFVFEKSFFDYLDGDDTILEKKPLETLAKSNQLSVFKHDGFWHPMDTLRDKNYLNNMWQNNPLWKKWD